MSLKPAEWFGVYGPNGRLFDVFEGEFTAAETADEQRLKTKKPFIVVPVAIVPVEHLPPARAMPVAPAEPEEERHAA